MCQQSAASRSSIAAPSCEWLRAFDSLCLDQSFRPLTPALPRSPFHRSPSRSRPSSESGSGWPSFYAKFAEEHVIERPDNSIPFMPRVEVLDKKSGAHLGHVFNDGPRPTGKVRSPTHSCTHARTHAPTHIASQA